MRIKDFSNSAKINLIMKAIKGNFIWNTVQSRFSDIKFSDNM